MRVVLLPCVPYELGVLERWANELGRQGWRIRLIPLFLPFLAVLEPAEPAKYRLYPHRVDYHGYYCRVPFLRLLLIEGEPEYAHSPDEMQVAGYMALCLMPICSSFITLAGLRDICIAPLALMLADTSLFGEYVGYTVMLAIVYLDLLVNILAFVAYMANYLTRRSSRRALITFRVICVTELIWIVWLVAFIIVLATAGIFYPVAP